MPHKTTTFTAITTSQPPPTPPDLAQRLATALPTPWKARWWRLYADSLQLQRRSSLAVYRAVMAWSLATGAPAEEVAALFCCYHDDEEGFARWGCVRYGEVMWRLCRERGREREREEEERRRPVSLGLVSVKTW